MPMLCKSQTLAPDPLSISLLQGEKLGRRALLLPLQGGGWEGVGGSRALVFKRAAQPLNAFID